MKTKNSILLFSVIFAFISLEAATYRVTPGASAGGNGQSWDSPMTIAEAIAAAKADETDDIILCKAGTYTPTATIVISTAMTVRGGLKGTDDETLAENGERSVFDTQNNTAASTIFSVTTTSGLNTFEGIEVRNAYQRGFNKSGAGSLSFKNCVFDSCGRKWSSPVASDIRGLAGKFEGGKNATLTFDNCVFSRNIYESNEKAGTEVGYGLAVGFKKWKRVIIDNSLFISNGLGKACLYSTAGGKGLNNVRGAAIYASESPLTVRNTEFKANRTGISAAYGGIVYIRYPGGETTSNKPTYTAFTNCLFLANSCEHCASDSSSKEASVLVLRSKVKDELDVVNCTFAYNFTASANNVSAGIDVGSSNSKANIRNSIFYGAQKTSGLKCGKDICVTSGCTANIDYCLFEENSTACISGAGTINKGSNNVFGDPRFVRAITANEIASIMVNNGSYYGYAADAYEKVFSKANVHARNRKLTVDTGDPASPYSNEPSPNGERVNLGYYGNTPEALSSAVGMLFFVR